MFIHHGKEMCRAIDLVLICPSCRFRTRRPIARSRFLTCGQESHRLARSGMATHKMINPWWRHTIPFPLAAPSSSQRRSSVRNGGNSDRLHGSGMLRSRCERSPRAMPKGRRNAPLFCNVFARRLLAIKEPKIAIQEGSSVRCWHCGVLSLMLSIAYDRRSLVLSVRFQHPPLFR